MKTNSQNMTSHFNIRDLAVPYFVHINAALLIQVYMAQ